MESEVEGAQQRQSGFTGSEWSSGKQRHKLAMASRSEREGIKTEAGLKGWVLGARSFHKVAYSMRLVVVHRQYGLNEPVGAALKIEGDCEPNHHIRVISHLFTTVTCSHYHLVWFFTHILKHGELYQLLLKHVRMLGYFMLHLSNREISNIG